MFAAIVASFWSLIVLFLAGCLRYENAVIILAIFVPNNASYFAASKINPKSLVHLA